jgi:CHASE3 domain sensor protein
MLDPVSIIGIATTAYKGLKAAVEAGQEIQDVMGQLSQWAGAIADLDKLDELNKKKKNSLFTSLIPKNGSSVEQEAMKIYTARIQAREQRSEVLRIIGYTQGEHGLREFIELEKKIRKERRELVHKELERKEKLKELAIGGVVVLLGIFTIVGAIALMIAMKETQNG